MKRMDFGWPLVLTAALVGAMTLTAKSQETNAPPAPPGLSLDALAVPISTYLELQKQYLEAVESLLDTKQAAFESAAQLELLTGKDAP
jgi:hypothetical protein